MGSGEFAKISGNENIAGKAGKEKVGERLAFIPISADSGSFFIDIPDAFRCRDAVDYRVG